jgi:hypothetical protein
VFSADELLTYIARVINKSDLPGTFHLVYFALDDKSPNSSALHDFNVEPLFEEMTMI